MKFFDMRKKARSQGIHVAFYCTFIFFLGNSCAHFHWTITFGRNFNFSRWANFISRLGFSLLVPKTSVRSTCFLPERECENIKQQNIKRQWLWQYHLDLFIINQYKIWGQIVKCNGKAWNELEPTKWYKRKKILKSRQIIKRKENTIISMDQ